MTPKSASLLQRPGNEVNKYVGKCVCERECMRGRKREIGRGRDGGRGGRGR